MTITVSVIIPVYNAKDYITECIDSVLSQTFTNVEIICVDDDSSDNSWAILNEYAAKDDRVICAKNNCKKGAAGARNTGINLSVGQYICFLDSDDYFDSRKIEVQYSAMLNSGANFSYTSYAVVNKDGLNVGGFDVVLPTSFKKLLYTCDIGCSTVMVEREFISSERFPYSCKEDYAFWLVLFSNVNIKAICIPDRLTNYRIGDSSLSSNKFKEVFRQWSVLRMHGGVSIFKSALCLMAYGLSGLIKHVVNYRVK